MASDTTRANSPLRPWLIRMAVSLSIALVVIVFVQDVFQRFGFFERTALSFIDRAFEKRGPLPFPKDSLDVVIVSISDVTETTVPDRYPFPRSYYARAIRNLNRAGVKAIGIDLTFEQPDINGPHNDDTLFAAIAQYRNVVVAGKTDLREEGSSVAREEENFHSIFYAADSSVGIVYVPNDADGVYRRYMPFAKVPDQERYVPTFAFAVYNKVLGLPSTTAAENLDRVFRFGGHDVPKFDDVSMLVNYHGPAGTTFRKIDIANILDDSTFQTNEERELNTPINLFDDPDIGILYDGSLRGKIVLIGPYFAESKDLFNVSVTEPGFTDRNQMYGVELHANALQTLIHGNFLTRPSPLQETLLVMLLSLITFAAVSWFKSIKTQHAFIIEIVAVIIVAGIIDGILALSYHLFTANAVVLPVVSPIAAVLFNYIGSAVYQYLTERKQKTMIKGMFSQYLNPSVVNELIAHPEKLRLGGEKKELTVFFSDIASFTNFSEKLDATDLVAILNEYLSAMTDIIMKHDGTLDKYVGDAVMAVWGAPMELPNNALSACRAALSMQSTAQEIAAKWEREGKPKLVVRMGLNTDMMVVGNVGGSARFDYTVIGDAVNLGSRLEGANKEYGTRIMVSERTQELVKEELLCRELDLLVVKGKTKPVRVFELVGERKTLPSERTTFIAAYTEALALYRGREFKKAVKAFEQLLLTDPNDGPAALYLERSTVYAKKAPPKDWNGVFELKTK